MKKTKKLLAIVLSLVMLLSVIPLSVLAEEAQTVEKGVWVAGVKVYDGNYAQNASYWVNDGEGSITQEGATEKNYNVKFQYSTLTLKNVNLSKLYEYYSKEATDYKGDSLGYTLKEAAVIYSNIYSLTIALEGKNNTITAKVDDTETVRYQSVAGICGYYKELIPGSPSYRPQYNICCSINLIESGKLDLNVSKGNQLYNGNEVCKGIYFYMFTIRDNPKITVSDSDVAFYCGETYSYGYGSSAGRITIYNGTFEIKCNNMAFNVSPYNEYIRDPKIVVSADKSGETTEKYEEHLSSLNYKPQYKYVKIKAHSAFTAFFMNTFEGIAEYLFPQYLMFFFEVLMQFPLFLQTLIEWILGMIL